MRQFIAQTKEKGATPILLSLTVRQFWKEGKIERGSGRYGQMIAELAKEQGLEFLDLTNIVANQYETMGEEKVKAMFGPDNVHTSPAGAELNAASVVSGLKQLKNVRLDAYLSEKGKAVPILSAAPAASAASPAMATTAPVTTDPPAPGAVFRLRPLPVPADPALPTLFFIGDSTVRNGNGDGGGGQWGWGEPIAAYFDQAKINVVNRAVGGLSSRTYLTSGYWEATKAMIKPGDIVMMQFGHNDSGAINDTSRARATLRGVGDESEAIDNLLTKKPEVVHTYGWYLRLFVAETKAKGGIPIICSPIPRKNFSEGKASRSAATYAGWAGQVAKSQGVAFIDLNEIVARQYDVLGIEKVEPLFADANTHTSLAGAEMNAASVVAGLKTLRSNPLAPYFSTKAAGVAQALETEVVGAVVSAVVAPK
jgi:lysophospholipase L1-like esterase